MGKEGYVYTGAWSLQETSIPSCPFCCEPKTPLKKNSEKQKWMIAKTESLIKIIKSIVPTEIWKCCNRFLYEWKSQMMLTLLIKLPEWMLRQSQSGSSLYTMVISSVRKNEEY